VFSQRHSSTVQCDVDRSLWHLTPDWSDDRRAAKRAALQRVLNGAPHRRCSAVLWHLRRGLTRSAPASLSGVVGLHCSSVYYYQVRASITAGAVTSRALNQPCGAVSPAVPVDIPALQGLHDIASVLLLVCGEAAAYPLLERLALFHLRDCTRATLEPVTQLLALLFPLLARVDPPLHAFLQRSGVLPYFALTWVLTWHVHDVRDLPTAARLFDLFLSSSPLLPLYVGVAALLAERAAVMALPCDASEVHRFLTSLNVLGRLSADELATRALALHRAHPPLALQQLAGMRLPKGSALAMYPFPFLTERQRPDRVLRARPRSVDSDAELVAAKRPRAGALRVAGAVGTSAAVLGTMALLGGNAGPLGVALRALLAGGG
jgi:hypothetical protein